MILCTAYGLLIYECTIAAVEEKETKEEKKSGKQKAASAERDNDKPRISLNASYKLSVLPDERVLDCLSFETT